VRIYSGLVCGNMSVSSAISFVLACNLKFVVNDVSSFIQPRTLTSTKVQGITVHAEEATGTPSDGKKMTIQSQQGSNPSLCGPDFHPLCE
jgi:hypothetical protein